MNCLVCLQIGCFVTPAPVESGSHHGFLEKLTGFSVRRCKDSPILLTTSKIVYCTREILKGLRYAEAAESNNLSCDSFTLGNRERFDGHGDAEAPVAPAERGGYRTRNLRTGEELRR